MSEIIAVFSGRGGTGKSVIVSLLGMRFKRQKKSVLLLDLSLGMRSLDQLFSCSEKVVYDITDISSGRKKSKNVIFSIGEELPDLLPASQTADWFSLNEDRLKLLLTQLRERYDVILLDTSSGWNISSRFAVDVCDRAIITESPDTLGIRGLDRMSHLIRKHRESIDPYVILNRYMPGAVSQQWQGSVDEIADLTGLRILGWLPWDMEFYRKASSGEIASCRSGEVADRIDRICRVLMGEDSADTDLRSQGREKSSFISRIFRRG